MDYFQPTLHIKRRPEKVGGVWLINMQCSGHESSLLMCSHDISVRLRNCKGKRKAGVKCKPKGNIYPNNGQKSVAKNGNSPSESDLS